ncbi:Homeobox protein DBX1 [Halotydeus destructor]|nr:Homeobox protein DBX1 [Halotydeus destructor]
MDDILSRPCSKSSTNWTPSSSTETYHLPPNQRHISHHSAAHQPFSRTCGPPLPTVSGHSDQLGFQYQHFYQHYQQAGKPEPCRASEGSGGPSMQHHPLVGLTSPDGVTYQWVSPPKALPRKRTVFSRGQRTQLELKFQKQKYISKPDRIKFAKDLCLKDSQVKVWFINRRTKWRNDREKRLNKARADQRQRIDSSLMADTKSQSAATSV